MRRSSGPAASGQEGVAAGVVDREALSALLELAPDAMVVVDADDGSIIALNTQTEQLFGYPSGELLGQPIERLLPTRFHDAHARRRAGYRADPARRPMGTGLDLWGCRRDGREFPVDISLSPVNSTTARRVVVASVRDVTERRRAEETRARLAAIVESSDDAIIAKDPDGTILSWNRAAERLYGYDAADAIGRPVSILAAPDREDEIPELIAAIARGESVDHHETVRRRKDGTLIDVSVTISPIRDPNGTIIGASTIARDVSQRRQLELRRAQFIANAAHELRTPLAALAALAEVLADHFSELPPNRIAECLETLRRQGERAGALVANLVDLSQLEQGSIRLRPEALILHEAIRQALAAAPPPETTTVTVSLHPGLRVSADPVRLIQILTNLLTNAYRYGGPTVCIEAEEGSGRVKVAVTDDGPGVPADAAASLFDPFTRSVEVAHPRGSGVGLAVCRRLVEAHDGRIWSEPISSGARFVFTLPAA